MSKTRIKNSIPIPPGEILIEEFMRHFGFSQNRRARGLDVPVTRINVDQRHVLNPIGGLARPRCSPTSIADDRHRVSLFVFVRACLP